MVTAPTNTKKSRGNHGIQMLECGGLVSDQETLAIIEIGLIISSKYSVGRAKICVAPRVEQCIHTYATIDSYSRVFFPPHIISASLLSRTTGKSDTTSGTGNDKTNLLLCMSGENYSIACIFFIFPSKHLQDKIEALHKEPFGHNAKIQTILD